MPTSSLHHNKSPQSVNNQHIKETNVSDQNTSIDYSRLEYLKYKEQQAIVSNNSSSHGPPKHYENLPLDGQSKRWDEGDQIPARDPASLKSIKYGPGHEKFPSWPGSAPGPTDKPHRSHSWTQQTNYPKERSTGYARPTPKRPTPSYTQQLKTVVERCEKMDNRRRYLPRLDREGNALGDQDYMTPSPPERDKPPIMQTDIDSYCQDSNFTKIHGHGDYATPYDDLDRHHHLTQAHLEEYSRNEESLKVMHQHQGSYAQSEGYHSYVSSSELTNTPFLDRLRQESESQNNHGWEEGRKHQWHQEVSQDRTQAWEARQDGRSQSWTEARDQAWEEDTLAGRDSVVTTSSGSVSSSETLKCHGSMSDVSVASSSCRSKQQIAHSSRVAQPQRHHSESVLYLSKSDRSQQLKLFPVSTYIVQPSEATTKPVISPSSQPQLSVAERISELERHQQQQQQQRFLTMESERKGRLPDPNLKAIQKKALLSFYERHHSTGPGLPMAKPKDSWKSEPQLAQKETIQRAGVPQPPPRPIHSHLNKTHPQHSSSMGSLHAAVIVGSPISIDDWVPERPPKKLHLRTPPIPSPIEVPVASKTPERAPSPDLPLPPPPPPTADEEIPDEPLPPPPEAEWLLATAVPRRSTPGPASPREDPPLSQVQGTFGSVSEKEMVLGMVVPPDEIKYDPEALNAILECNRSTKDLQRRRQKKREDPPTPRSHIENRPPLPLPRDAQPEPPKPNCDLDDFEWLSQYEKARKKKTLSQALESAPGNPFIRSGKDTGVRASIKTLKNEMVSRMSLRFPKEKPRPDQSRFIATEPMQRSISVVENSPRAVGTAVRVTERSISDSGTSAPPPLGPKIPRYQEDRTGHIKKVSDYEPNLPVREKSSALSVFPRRMSEELSPDEHERSNSKASYLAIRREKELGINNYEGSYKLTMSPSGETIDPRSPEKPTLTVDMIKLKEKSTENLVLTSRIPLEPPDLIPKMSSLNCKSHSIQDICESSQNEFSRGTYDRYRLPPASFNPRIGSNRVAFAEITSISEDKSENDVTIRTVSPSKSESELRDRLAEMPEMRRIQQISLENPIIPEPTKIAEEIKSEDLGTTITPPDVTRTRHLVERSTSFGRGDSMTIINVEVEADVDGDTDAGIALSDAASQTDLVEDPDDVGEQHDEDLEVERLSRDLASQLSPSDKLLSLLVPAAERKKPSDYVADLLRLEGTTRRRHTRKHKTGSCVSNVSSSSASSTTSASTTSSSSSSDRPLHQTSHQDLSKPEPESPLPASSPYYTTSESKAKLLARYPSGVESLPIKDSEELKQKKEELMQRLDKKLTVLREEQLSLGEESGLNDELGAAVAAQVARVARPHEATKYRLHVEEVGKITSLLLGLSGRLARAENALFALPQNHSERKIHEEKRNKLREQLMEAKLLKESIDRRSDTVSKTLGKYLSEEDLADYLHFIHMKEKLIVDAREVADKIALGEEQLAALKETNHVWA